MEKQHLARAIFEKAHLTGEFRLRSGQIANQYFDKYRFEADPRILRSIAHHLVPLIPADTQVLGGLEMGGIPIATALSLETGLPATFVRKEAKSYGTCQLAEGYEVANKKLCIIEDVITTGGQVVTSAEQLRKEGAQINNVVCVIHRGEGSPTKLHQAGLSLSALFTMDELNQTTGSNT